MSVDTREFKALFDYLLRIPALKASSTPSRGISFGNEGDGWWIKFDIDIRHPLAWNVVQEMAHVLNYLSIEERLPSRFMPVSPPPYLNGGPEEFLSWVIECPNTTSPETIAQWLEGRLPRPVDDPAQWGT